MKGVSAPLDRLARAKLLLELRNLRADTKAKEALGASTLLANQKLIAETNNLSRESRLTTRLFGLASRLGKLLSVGLALATAVVALFSAIHAYNQGQSENFRSLLKDLADGSANVRLSAVARLATYQQTETVVRRWARELFGEPSPKERSGQIIGVVAASLHVEDNINVKNGLLRLLKEVGSADETVKGQSIAALQQVRNDFIRLLKAEHKEKPHAYWENLRETLFEVALQIAQISEQPPDLRCFPLRGVRLRQRVLPAHAKFDGATLAFAELWGGRINDATFTRANLNGAVVRDVDLTGTTFSGADLTGTTFGPNLGNIDGMERTLFQGSNWQMVRSFQPPQLRRILQRNLGAKTIQTSDGGSRDVFCSDVLNREFRADGSSPVEWGTSEVSKGALR